MKIGRLSFESDGHSIIAEEIDIENLADLTNLIVLLEEETRFVSPVCSYQRVCDDYPKKCPECAHRPKKSYFSTINRLAPAPLPTKKIST